MSYQDLKDCKIITAFITPFHEDGSINFDAIPKLIEHLLAHHTDGILLAGTTAESPTLTHDEELQLFAAVQKVVNGRVPLIAGVGTNDTRDSIEFVKEVAEFGGFAAGLAIVPYYNKPSQEGMYQHFKAIAEFPGAVLEDDVAHQIYPQAVNAVGSRDTFVGRIRKDLDAEKGIHMWVVSDNLLKGAAWNSVQIAETLHERGLVRPTAELKFELK